jgi:hypothetical protein
MANHKKGRTKGKKEDRRRWDGVSTSGRAARIQRRRSEHKSGRRSKFSALRSWGYKPK